MSSNQSICVPVILCGGTGTRLWPLSRTNTPKQFVPLQGQKTLFELTLNRLAGMPLEQALVVSSELHRFFVAEGISKAAPAFNCTTLLEPIPRDTAPAISLAALHTLKMYGNQPLLVMPSDHIIHNNDAFQKTLTKIFANLEKDTVATLGIHPQKAHTGYGYLEQGEVCDDGLFEVRTFHEKPTAQIAQQWLDKGSYYWNSGIFVFYAQHYLDLLEHFNKDIFLACQATYEQAQHENDCLTFPLETFSRVKKISCDYAIMEQAEKMRMLPADMGWSDVGSWSSMGQMFKRDSNDNETHGDVVVENATGNTIYAGQRMVSVLGLNDCVVVETADAVLLAARDELDGLKQLVNKMKEDKRPEVEWGLKVFRPWGSYEKIDEGDNFQAKRLVVKPGQVLSLQKHHKRSEHWVVVKGTARVTNGDKVFNLKENESTYIPAGTKHRLENCTKEDIFLIEVQCGSYLGEDDIVRYEDIYGRTK
ncbi:MAG: mannose-1-phosphate guanylyltransferase/mannose-6-phosphate isomerase [Candidatus Oxydemutatoraceae bacterium WSBS_2016_MAG_OTU14]